LYFTVYTRTNSILSLKKTVQVVVAAKLNWANCTAPCMLYQTPEPAEKQVQRWLGTQAMFLKI